MCRASASPWAVASATRTPVNEPGPRVATTPSSPARSRPAARSSRSTPAITSSDRGVGPESATRPGATAAGESNANSRRGPHAAIASTDLTAAVLPLRRVTSSTRLQSPGHEANADAAAVPGAQAPGRRRDAPLPARGFLRALLRGRGEGGAHPRHRAHASAPQRSGQLADVRDTAPRGDELRRQAPGGRAQGGDRRTGGRPGQGGGAGSPAGDPHAHPGDGHRARAARGR